MALGPTRRLSPSSAWLLGLFLLLGQAPDGRAAPDDIERAGDLIAIGLPLAGLALTELKDDPAGRTPWFQSLLAAGVTTVALKNLVDKKRPNGESQSFPSGHAADAFTAAGFIDIRYGHRYGLPAYVAAGFVAWSRVEADKHYLEDVLAGAALGYASARWFTGPLTLGVTPDQVTLRWQGRW